MAACMHTPCTIPPTKCMPGPTLSAAVPALYPATCQEDHQSGVVGPGPGEFLCSIVSAIISQQVQRARGGEEPRRVRASWSSSFPSPIAIENERTTCEGLASARGSGWVLGLAEFPCGIASYVAPGPHTGVRVDRRARGRSFGRHRLTTGPRRGGRVSWALRCAGRPAGDGIALPPGCPNVKGTTVSLAGLRGSRQCWEHESPLLFLALCEGRGVGFALTGAQVLFANLPPPGSTTV